MPARYPLAGRPGYPFARRALIGIGSAAKMADQNLYERIVDAANAVYGSHPGRRALHAKGSWVRGTFTATAEAAALSSAAHMRGEPIEALARFSNASGDPEAHDADRDGRGLALKLRFDGGETDILATTSPTFLTRTPEEFYELMTLRRPDPASGEPDLGKLGAFLAAHPESQPAVQAVLMSEPLDSFAAATYFSPHAFALVAGDGARSWVRYRWRPEAGERRVPDDEARARGRDYLHDELAERLRAETVAFELCLQLAEDDDPLDDPTAVWPEERRLLRAGRLDLIEPVDDPEHDGHIEVFDPARIVDGIELSDDPILLARPQAYSVSAYRRLGRA